MGKGGTMLGKNITKAAQVALGAKTIETKHGKQKHHGSRQRLSRNAKKGGRN